MSDDFLRRRPLVGGLAISPPADAAFLIHFGGARLGNPLAALLPLVDANADLLSSAPDVLKAAGSTPVLAGVCATDPTRILDRLIDDVQAAGFGGVVNMPSVAFFDGVFRANLEATGLGYGREVDLISRARRRGLTALGLAFTPDEARRMADAGAQALIVPSDRLAEVRAAPPGLPLLVAGPPAPGLDGHVEGFS